MLTFKGQMDSLLRGSDNSEGDLLFSGASPEPLRIVDPGNALPKSRMDTASWHTLDNKQVDKLIYRRRFQLFRIQT